MLNKYVHEISKCDLGRERYNYCSLTERRNSGYNQTRAKCNYKGCREFKCEIQQKPTGDTEVPIQIYINCPMKHGQSIIKKAIKGAKRILLGKLVEEKGAANCLSRYCCRNERRGN